MSQPKTIEQHFNEAIRKFVSSKILLAVSGGVDSMVLLHLLKKSSNNFEVAHCNFNLRGEESEKDYLFVKKSCLQYDIVFNGKKFDTTAFAKENGLSIQMAARQLRYTWFSEIIQVKKLEYLATAHHQNDQTETVLLNILRGKGSFTWEGMHIFNNSIIRPLLNVSKKELVAYAKENKIEWREDSSNEKSDYQRNFIRNTIIPELEKHFPSAENNLLQFAEINRYNNTILRQFINEKKLQLCSSEDGILKINSDLLIKENEAAVLLFHLINTYGFNFENCNQMIQAKNSSGKKFYSASYIALIDRSSILIKKSEIINSPSLFIENISKPIIYNQIEFSFREIPNQHIELKTQLKSVALIDQQKIAGLLELRTYREGDYFYPLGMKGKKLLSDFFIDEKINEFDKKQIPLLCDNHQIIWIAGYRLDERYKVTDTTENILRVDITKVLS
ncbi:MAG: tRNA lysidine(34) synthetase TilS [Bacteroidota bacterium]|jgi:tRNA(Ile)-lysidine synthase